MTFIVVPRPKNVLVELGGSRWTHSAPGARKVVRKRERALLLAKARARHHAHARGVEQLKGK